jgi:hypothetical protein
MHNLFIDHDITWAWLFEMDDAYYAAHQFPPKCSALEAQFIGGFF